MKKYLNGKYIELTAKEIAVMKAEHTRHELMEKIRPLTENEVSRMIIAQQINSLPVDDNTALRMTEFYPEWIADNVYSADYKVRRNSSLWRCRQEHTSQTGWEPENAASLWEQINETHAGTLDDPIPYSENMALESGKYYMQNYVIYLCNRDTGNPVYNPLADLVNVYVEMV